MNGLSSASKMFARIQNAPKFMFKSDILWFLKGCELKNSDVVFLYDDKYRPTLVQLQMDSVETFRLAQRSLAMKGRFGGRILKLTAGETEMDELNKGLERFRGRSLLMVRVPNTILTEDVERFFSGYRLDSPYPIKFIRPAYQNTLGPGVNRIPSFAVRSEIEVRALVRFKTELEALRALREKQGSFCMERPIDLRFIE